MATTDDLVISLRADVTQLQRSLDGVSQQLVATQGASIAATQAMSTGFSQAANAALFLKAAIVAATAAAAAVDHHHQPDNDHVHRQPGQSQSILPPEIDIVPFIAKLQKEYAQVIEDANEGENVSSPPPLLSLLTLPLHLPLPLPLPLPPPLQEKSILKIGKD